MRFLTSTFIFPVLLASSALADQCVCNDEGSIASGASSYSDGWQSSGSVTHHSPIEKLPKVPATPANLIDGAQQAVAGLVAQNLIPTAVAVPVAAAVSSAVAKAAASQRIVYKQHGLTSTTTLAPAAATVTKIATDGHEYTVTQTVTALPAGATILSNTTLAALDDIQNSINDAIAAVNLSETGLDAAAQAEMSTCLKAVLNNGGLPAGYSCISQSGSTSAGLKATFNNVLEQFLGILPSKIIDDLQDAVMPMLTDLLPSESTLLGNINSAISSVVSSLSGNSVTAIEMMQSCYSLAIKQHSNTSYLQCYLSSGGPFDTLETAMNGVIEQFVGVLPGSVIESVQNLTSSTLKAGAYDDVSSIGTNMTAQLNNALSSVTDALTGNAVTLMQELQECANEVLINANATAAQECLANKAAGSAETMVNSVAQQYSGYLPSSFFTDLASIVTALPAKASKYSKDQIITALDQAYNNANMGPAYVGCFEQVQSCLLSEIVATGNYSSACSGPVAGCELIGSQNSTSLAAPAKVNTTIKAAAAIAVANTTTLSNVKALDASNESVSPVAHITAVLNATKITSVAELPGATVVTSTSSIPVKDPKASSNTVLPPAPDVDGTTSTHIRNSSIAASGIPTKSAFALAVASESASATSDTQKMKQSPTSPKIAFSEASSTSNPSAASPSAYVKPRMIRRAHAKIRVRYD